MEIGEYIVNKEYRIEENDSCFNCRFYRPHYIKDDEGQFAEVKSGTCAHPHVGKMSFIRCFGRHCPCNLWELSQPTEQKDGINCIIKNMAIRVEQIAKSLKID